MKQNTPQYQSSKVFIKNTIMDSDKKITNVSVVYNVICANLNLPSSVEKAQASSN